jgi:hypothetical protein
LTPDELSRYPWASRIDDYVPVGRMRKAGVLLGVGGVVVVLLGATVSLVTAANIHHAVNMHHWPTAVGVYCGMALTLAAAVLGIVTAVQGFRKRGSITLPWWSVVAIAPAVIVFLVIRPFIR